jgi:hypothetical protein
MVFNCRLSSQFSRYVYQEYPIRSDEVRHSWDMLGLAFGFAFLKCK